MNTLKEFISYVKSGVAKNNKFLVAIHLPESLAGMREINMRRVILFCDQTSIPGTSFASAPIRSYGETREVPYERLYEQVTLGFYVDADMTVKYLFDKWIELIQNPTSRDYSYPQQYRCNSIEIRVGNNEEEMAYNTTLYNCFPKAIAPIQLDYAGKEVMKMNITISYEYYTTKLLATEKSINAAIIPPVASSMPTYDYGYLPVEMPPEYFNNFRSFQNRFDGYDFASVDGVISSFSRENIGEFTGYTGVFT